MVRIIKVNPLDNVVIPVQDAPRGTEAAPGLKTTQDIPQGHKIALKDLKKGEEVIRYGVSLGALLKDIPAGGHIDEYSLEMPPIPGLDKLPWLGSSAKGGEKKPGESSVSTGSFPANLPAVFDGFPVPGNPFAGTRNILGIMTAVQCVTGVMNVALQKIKAELLPRYPNVEDVVVINHSYGCGVSIAAPGSEIPIRTLKNMLKNPNFGGEIMIVALGCEKLTLDMLLEAHENNAENVIVLQKLPGFKAMIDTVCAMAEKKLQRLNQRKRVTLPLEKLCIGIQCGGSDSFSGITANPAAGYASDLLVRAGGTVLFSEVTEVRDGVQYLAARCASPELSQKLSGEMKWYDAYLERGGADATANPSPGNKAGGLSNIMEKTMGSIAKSGSAPITGILAPGEYIANSRGLIFAATPASDFVCGPLQLASGITLQVFMTGRGTPYGLAAAPVIKVSSRTDMKNLWEDLIDINAGTIAEGKETIPQVGERLYKMILDTASGRHKPFAEKYRLFNDICLFDPAPVT
ncbi:MAG: UxaA family hydrolase [Treponema sp.]|nr:UxaA family hydrolase [Treponema sp.]